MIWGYPYDGSALDHSSAMLLTSTYATIMDLVAAMFTSGEAHVVRASLEGLGGGGGSAPGSWTQARADAVVQDQNREIEERVAANEAELANLREEFARNLEAIAEIDGEVTSIMRRIDGPLDVAVLGEAAARATGNAGPATRLADRAVALQIRSGELRSINHRLSARISAFEKGIAADQETLARFRGFFP